MGFIAVFFNAVIYPLIIGLAGVTLFGFVKTVMGINKLEGEMNDKHRNTRRKKEFTGSGLKLEPDVYTLEEILGYLEEFNKIQLNYSVFVQLVPVFPLLGILGTVAGLIEKLGNIVEMESALSISMGTTFAGLLAAIYLKIIDAVWVNRSINKMTLFFDTFEQNYQMAKDKHIEAVGKQSAGE